MTITSFSTLVAANHDNEGVVRLKLSYVDMAGDLIAGLVLSELMYWYAPSKDGKPDKLRIIKEGVKWIACPRDKWHERARITARQFDRAIKILISLKLVERKLFRFNGSPTVHVRIIEEEFLRRYNAILEGIILDFDESVNYTDVKFQQNKKGNSSTTKRRKHITSDTSADTKENPDATAPDAPAPPKPEKPKVSVKPKPSDTTPRRELEKRDALYEDVERIIFEIVATDDDPYNFRGLCGNITKWLRGEIRKFKNEALPASPVVEITPSHLEEFVRRYRKTNSDTSIPTYPPKFANHWSRLMSHTRTAAQPSQNGATSYRDELDRALKTILHPRTGQPLTSAQRSIARDLVTARHYDADAQLEALESILLEHVP